MTEFDRFPVQHSYDINIDANPFFDSLDGEFKDIWPEVQDLNRALRTFEKISDDDETVVGNEEENFSYGITFDLVYNRNGGSGRIQFPRGQDVSLPVDAAEVDPYTKHFSFYKEEEELTEEDEEAIRQGIGEILDEEMSRRELENIEYEWEDGNLVFYNEK